jgi:hypothetical protein
MELGRQMCQPSGIPPRSGAEEVGGALPPPHLRWNSLSFLFSNTFLGLLKHKTGLLLLRNLSFVSSNPRILEGRSVTW